MDHRRIEMVATPHEAFSSTAKHWVRRAYQCLTVADAGKPCPPESPELHGPEADVKVVIVFNVA